MSILPVQMLVTRLIPDKYVPAVPVRLIASFKRMKQLTKDVKVIVAALETSPELVISGHRVRRKQPLPIVDEAEVLMRTVLAENLPEHSTIGAAALLPADDPCDT